MERRSVEAIARALNQARVRYLVAPKEKAGRPEDRIDLQRLRALREEATGD